MYSIPVLPSDPFGFLPLEYQGYLFPQLSKAGLYELPVSQTEVWQRSRMNAHVQAHLENTVRKMFPRGRRNTGMFRTGRYVIALVAGLESNTGQYLYPGQWIDLAYMVIGNDVAELYAYNHGTTYRDAVRILSDQFDLDAAIEPVQQSEKLSGMVQETKPLHVPEFPFNRLPFVAEWIVYKNTVGNPIGVVARWCTVIGETVTLYFTLWRRRGSPVCHWVETFHDSPFTLFNVDQIGQNLEMAVVIVLDEFVARDLSERFPELIFSAVPGGSVRLPDTNLTPLSGRSVIIVLRPADLSLCKVIEHKLKTAGVIELLFMLGLEDKPKSFADIETLAVERGIVLQDPPADAPAANPALVSVTVEGLLGTKLPQRKYLLLPILPKQGLAMLYAVRGIGKTLLALGIAIAVTTGGSFLRWRAPERRRVLYIDGEMPAVTMQERLNFLLSGSKTQPEEGFLRIVTPDMQDGPMPDLSTAEGQAAIEPFLADVDLVVLDNLSSLCRNSQENLGDAWVTIQSWLLDLRRRGITVLIVHHAGKSGGQRGTSRREDVLDTVINLRRPNDYEPSQGARFEVHLEKGRDIFGEIAEPFEAALDTRDGKAVWHVCEIVDETLEQSRPLFNSGKSVRQVAKELGVSKSAAGRLRKRLEEDGQCGAEGDSDD